MSKRPAQGLSPHTFGDQLHDALRLPVESRLLALNYVHRYEVFQEEGLQNRIDGYVWAYLPLHEYYKLLSLCLAFPDLICYPPSMRRSSSTFTEGVLPVSRGMGGRITDSVLLPQMLTLTSVYLSTLVLSLPRRISATIAPAWSLLHPELPPLAIPSATYGALRDTLVRCLHQMLRVLGFKSWLLTPASYLSGYLSSALHHEFRGTTERYEHWLQDERELGGVIPIMSTSVGNECSAAALKAAKSRDLSMGFAPQTIALASVCKALDKCDIGKERRSDNMRDWVNRIGREEIGMREIKDVLHWLE